MNKYLKIALIVLGVGIIGYAVYWFYQKNKSGTTDNNGNALPPPPAVQTPPDTALQATDTGAGLAAINRRAGEILNSSAWVGLQSQVQNDTNILTGVTVAKKPYYNLNIARAPITSAKNIPYNLNAGQKAALQAFDGIDDIGGWTVVANLRSANMDMFNALDTCFIGGPELTSDQEFAKQVICQGYQDCGKNYIKLNQNSNEVGNGAKKAQDDMQKMADAWLHGAIAFDHLVTSKAIDDLRAAGWRFTGYDH